MKEEEFSKLESRMKKAVDDYVKMGGVVKLKDGKIIYPEKKRIESQIEQVKKRLESLKQQKAELIKKKREYTYNSLILEATRFADPLYWNHLFKMLTDKNYKEVFETVKPPVERIKDAKWRSMIRMFVKSDEYRQRLFEAKTSKIGKSRETIRDSVEKNFKDAQDLISHRLKKIEREKKDLEAREKSFSSILKFL